MTTLNLKAIIQLVITAVVLAAAVFLPAGRLDYWQGWACLFSFFFPAGLITVYVAKNNPALLERRLKAGPRAETSRGQKVVQTITAVVLLAEFVVPAFDYRFGWAAVPATGSIAGDVFMILGFAIVFAVFRVNSFTSGVIEVAENQTVVSTGLYGVVRHPMYSGASLMLFGIPLALGSWWGMLVNVPMFFALAWRLLDEEKFLSKKLTGYAGYTNQVKYHLIPYLW